MTEHYRRIRFRRGTALRWAEVNPLLATGEPGIEIDTGKVKYGDGVTNWSGLVYSNTVEPEPHTHEPDPPSGITLAYGSDGKLSTVTRATGGVVTLTYGVGGNLTTVADSGSGVTKTLVYSGQVLQEVQVTTTP